MFPTKEFQEAAKDFVLVHIDIDKQQPVAQQHGVGGIPDIRFLTADGKEIHKVVGFVGLDGLLEEIKKAKAGG